jgi:hypothetical protein
MTYHDPAADGGLPSAGGVIGHQQADDEIVDIEVQNAAEAAETARAEAAETAAVSTAEGAAGTVAAADVATETTRAETAEGANAAAIGAKYTRPSGGIPESDLSSAVQTVLNGAYVTTGATVIAAAGAALTVTWSAAAPEWDVTLNAPLCTLTLPTPAPGTSAKLRLNLTVGTAGANVSWPSNVESIGAIVPLTTTVGAVNLIELTFDGVANWVMDGVVGPSNSADPVSTGGCVMAVEAAAQALLEGATIKPTGGTVTALTDRSGSGNGLAATTPNGPTGMVFHGRGNPYAGGGPFALPVPFVDLLSSGNGSNNNALTSTAAFPADAALIVAYAIPPSGVTQETGILAFTGVSSAAGTARQFQVKPSGNGYIYTGAFCNFAAPGVSNGSTGGAYVLTVAQGAQAPQGASEMTIRSNGTDISNTINYGLQANFTATGFTIGGANQEFYLAAAYLIEPCPTLVNLKRFERFAAAQASAALAALI